MSMIDYHNALGDIIRYGVNRECRNATTRSCFGIQMRFDLNRGFPAVTTKRLAFKSVKAELLGFLRGYDHARQFQKLGTNIWNANADAWGRDGELGRIYGVQWREWQGADVPIDQLANVIEQIKTNPTSGEHIVTAWNPGELDEMALPPCHVFFQFFVVDNRLSLQMYQRSCDMFLGMPFNIASYALLLSMVAQVTDLYPEELIIAMGDAHIYFDHFDAVETQLRRREYVLPKLWLNPEITCIDDFKMQDIKLHDYRHHDAIAAPMIV